MSTARADLEDLGSALQALENALAAERASLEDHDVALLETATQQKGLAINALADSRFGTALAEKIAALVDAERTECEQLHTNHLNFARQLKDSNLVNGKILNRSHNSVREIINILSGKRAGGLYGESGQPTADSDASGPIARA